MTTPNWTEADFFENLRQFNDDEESLAVAKVLLEWIDRSPADIIIGEGPEEITLRAEFEGVKDKVTLFIVRRDKMGVNFKHLSYHKPFDSSAKRKRLFSRMSRALDADWNPEHHDREQSIKLSTLADPTTQTKFLDVLDWMVETARANQ
jgi:hypothetical protein